VILLAASALGALSASPASAAISGVSLSPMALSGSATEGSVYAGLSDTFTDASPDPASAFSAMVDWGDGTQSAATVTATGPGAFSITSAGHTWAQEGSFPVAITLSKGAETATASGTEVVGDADSLFAGPTTNVTPVAHTLYAGELAAFADVAANTSGDLTATIDWGDGTTSAGTVAQTPSGLFAVTGAHAYASLGSFPIVVTLSDNPPGTATAVAKLTANVSPGDELIGVVEPVTPFEGTTFSGAIAEFRDGLSLTPASAFQARIDWGDGATTAGTITGSGGSFAVSGAHVYVEEGMFPVAVTFSATPPNLATATAMRTETVIDAAVAGAPVAITAPARGRFSGSVATFTDGDPAGVPSDYSATIDWGDGHDSHGTVSASGGHFTVTGAHTYALPGSYEVTTTVADRGGSAMSVISRAKASAADLGLGVTATQTQNTLTYAMTVSNRGPSAAANITLSDALPAGTALGRISRGAFTCRASRSGAAVRTVTCRLSRLARGGKSVVTIAVGLERGHARRVSTAASVTSTVFDPRAANNRVSVSTRVG
jgi:uncharacterized repeat protein (TIGR01451 family)